MGFTVVEQIHFKAFIYRVMGEPYWPPASEKQCPHQIDRLNGPND